MTRPARQRARLLSMRAAAPLIVAGVLALAAASYGLATDAADMRPPATRVAAPAPKWKPRVMRTKTVSRPPAPRPTPPSAVAAAAPSPTPVAAPATALAVSSTSQARAKPVPADLPAAARVLVRLAAAQRAFAAGAYVDEDHDRRGEYGGFAELTGAASGRMPSRLRAPALDVGSAQLDAAGVLELDGYLFRIDLPGRFGDSVNEQRHGFGAGACEPDRAERAWACYAWPLRHGETYDRAYYLDHDGVLLVTTDPAYSGRTAGPAPDAAHDVDSWRPLD